MARIVNLMLVPCCVGEKLSIFTCPNRISLDQARTSTVYKSGIVSFPVKERTNGLHQRHHSHV